MKYIIFRYDRIGDFLISSILLNNIKNQDNNIKFTLVCSEKNYSYAKNSFLVDDILLIPNNFFKRIKFYFQIFRSKFNKAIVLDGKKKSILSALLIKCDQKILLTNKETIKKEATRYLDIFKDHPYIFNLGHGVLPETDPSMMDYLVKIVKNY